MLMAINRDVKSICFIARKKVVQLFNCTHSQEPPGKEFSFPMILHKNEKVFSTKEFLYFCVLLCLVGLDKELGHAILFKAFLCHVSFSFDFIIIRKADFLCDED